MLPSPQANNNNNISIWNPGPLSGQAQDMQPSSLHPIATSAAAPPPLLRAATVPAAPPPTGFSVVSAAPPVAPFSDANLATRQAAAAELQRRLDSDLHMVHFLTIHHFKFV